MAVDLDQSKAIISDQYDEDPEEHAIEIDRASLIEIVKAWQELLKNEATEITLLRDDENITMIGTFEDKPEFKKVFAYRLKDA